MLFQILYNTSEYSGEFMCYKIEIRGITVGKRSGIITFDQ